LVKRRPVGWQRRGKAGGRWHTPERGRCQTWGQRWERMDSPWNRTGADLGVEGGE
jgi:hypothetical protein